MNVYAQRLLNVARALRESPNPADFTMGSIYVLDGDPCKSPACAIGHYLLSPHNEGLSLDATWDMCEEHFGFVPSIFGDWSSDFWALFGGMGCGNAKTPEAAATYIERYVAKRWGLLSHEVPVKELETA